MVKHVSIFRKCARTARLLVLALLLVGVILFWRMSGVGQSGVEAWIGEQLQADVNARGNIRLTFDSIDYQAPNRVVLKRLHLARIFANGSAVNLIDVEQAQIDLDEIPRRGRPIRISTVELTNPIVHLEAFIRHDDRAQHPTTRPELSSVVRLKHVGITGGTIDYNDGSGGPPLSWSKLNVAMDIIHHEHGWHNSTILVDQSPLVTLKLSSDINLDLLALRNLRMKLNVDLNDPAALQFFTPRLQQFLKKFDVAGQLAIEATGSGSITDREAASFDATASLAGGRFTIGNYQLPIDRLDLAANLRGTVATLDHCTINLLDGQARASGTLPLTGDQQMEIQLVGEHMGLARLLREGGDESRRLRGLMDGRLFFVPTLPQLRLFNKPEGQSVVWMMGYLHVAHGRLVNLPIIGELTAATHRLSNSITGDRGVYKDELKMNVTGVGKHYELTDIDYMGDVVAARGHGTIAFNGDCDLILNAGPLENLQDRLGFLGRLWGRMTDKVMSYTVKGKLRSPEVKPQLGGG